MIPNCIPKVQMIDKNLNIQPSNVIIDKDKAKYAKQSMAHQHSIDDFGKNIIPGKVQVE